MAWWDDQAAALQRDVIDQDHRTAELPLLEDGKGVRRAIVHARQDMVLFVSMLSSLNKQARSIRLILWLILAALIVIAIRI